MVSLLLCILGKCCPATGFPPPCRSECRRRPGPLASGQCLLVCNARESPIPMPSIQLIKATFLSRRRWMDSRGGRADSGPGPGPMAGCWPCRGPGSPGPAPPPGNWAPDTSASFWGKLMIILREGGRCQPDGQLIFVVSRPTEHGGMVAKAEHLLLHFCLHRTQKGGIRGVEGTGEHEVLPNQQAWNGSEYINTYIY
jgi:hypothetical protein